MQFWVKGYFLPRLCNNMGRDKTCTDEGTRDHRYWPTYQWLVTNFGGRVYSIFGKEKDY